MKFNWVDIILIFIFLGTCYSAWKSKTFPEIIRLIGLFITFIISFNSYTLLSNFISDRIKLSGVRAEAISFMLLFLLTLAVFEALARVLNISKAKKEANNEGGMGNIAGLAIGFLRAALLVSIICVFLANSPFAYLSKSVKDKSFTYGYIRNIAPGVYNTGIFFYPGKKINTPLVELLRS